MIRKFWTISSRGDPEYTSQRQLLFRPNANKSIFCIYDKKNQVQTSDDHIKGRTQKAKTKRIRYKELGNQVFFIKRYLFKKNINASTLFTYRVYDFIQALRNEDQGLNVNYETFQTILNEKTEQAKKIETIHFDTLTHTALISMINSAAYKIGNRHYVDFVERLNDQRRQQNVKLSVIYQRMINGAHSEEMTSLLNAYIINEDTQEEDDKIDFNYFSNIIDLFNKKRQSLREEDSGLEYIDMLQSDFSFLNNVAKVLTQKLNINCFGVNIYRIRPESSLLIFLKDIESLLVIVLESRENPGTLLLV